MNKLRILFATVLCLSLLTFAGCGNNGNNDNMDGGVTDGTVTEDNDNVTDGMGNDVNKAVDDVEDAVDGNDNRSTKETTVNQ